MVEKKPLQFYSFTHVSQQTMSSEAVLPRCTHVARQEAYRKRVTDFFRSRDHYVRLQGILNKGESACAMLMYFVTKYSGNRVFSTTQGVFCPKDAYCDALRSHQKRFYNFESREGHGDLWYNGIQNPRVLANTEHGAIALPLPRLVALQWAIQMGFDEIFLREYKAIAAQYMEYTQAKKHKYTEAHKRKKKTLRAEMEKQVIDERRQLEASEPAAATENMDVVSANAPPPKLTARQRKRQKIRRNRRETRLTRTERQRVTELMREEKVRRQQLARLARLRTKKRDHTQKVKESVSMQCDADQKLVLDF